MQSFGTWEHGPLARWCPDQDREIQQTETTMYLTVMWNWGCFSGAFCDAAIRLIREFVLADTLCNAKMDTRLARSPPNPLHLRVRS